MDPNLKIALIGIVGGLIGGLVTGVVAPHVAWGIEKRRVLRQTRQELVKNARSVITTYRQWVQTSQGDRPLGFALAQTPTWLRIKPLVTDDVWQAIDAASESQIRSNEAQHALALLEEDINRIEQDWKLI